MTTNMQEMLDRAFEAGRTAERQMAAIASEGIKFTIATSNSNTGTDEIVRPTGNGTRKRRAAAPKATVAHKEPKAPVAAKATRKAAGPRTKGVKEAIVNLIGKSIYGITIADITELTSFKKTSVHATMMGLKKNGLAFQDDEKRWRLADNVSQSGNSELASEYA